MSFFTTLFFLGVVDRIEGNIVIAEIHSSQCAHTSHEEIVQIDFPRQFLPCEIRDGDVFYITVTDGVTEIRCGEPPQ